MRKGPVWIQEKTGTTPDDARVARRHGALSNSQPSRLLEEKEGRSGLAGRRCACPTIYFDVFWLPRSLWPRPYQDFCFETRSLPAVLRRCLAVLPSISE